MRNTNRSIVAISAALALMGAVSLAPSQAQESGQSGAAGVEQLDDSTLKAFAEASVGVQEVVDTWAPRIQEAETQQEEQQLRAQATSRMEEKVQSAGLDVQTYNQVYRAAQNDPELADTIEDYRAEVR